MLKIFLKTFTDLIFRIISKKFLFFTLFELKLCLLLKKCVGQISSNKELNNNNFKKEYIINIVNMWSKALLTFKNKTNELIKDSNTLKYNIL